MSRDPIGSNKDLALLTRPETNLRYKGSSDSRDSGKRNIHNLELILTENIPLTEDTALNLLMCVDTIPKYLYIYKSTPYLPPPHPLPPPKKKMSCVMCLMLWVTCHQNIVLCRERHCKRKYSIVFYYVVTKRGRGLSKCSQYLTKEWWQVGS